ncbi:MAG: hypothetical protein ACQESJ_11360, partial [Bacteroidota bacterium]
MQNAEFRMQNRYYLPIYLPSTSTIYYLLSTTYHLPSETTLNKYVFCVRSFAKEKINNTQIR